MNGIEMSPNTIMIQRLGMHFLQVHAVAAACELMLPDHIGDNICALDHLSAVTGCHPPSLNRLLRALCSIGVFVEVEGGFCNTPLSETLRRNREDSMHGWAQFMASPEMNRCIENLRFSIQTGKPAFDKFFGLPFFEYLNQHSTSSATFSAAMNSYSASLSVTCYTSRTSRSLNAWSTSGVAMVHYYAPSLQKQEILKESFSSDPRSWTKYAPSKAHLTRGWFYTQAFLTGRERNAEEYEALLRSAGFSHFRLIATKGFHTVMEVY